MSGTTTDPGDKTAAEIENEVERSRARVTETMDALRGKMSPGQITEQVLDYARSSGGAEFLGNLGTAVRENPLPVTLIGAGIAWLLVSGGGRTGAPAPAARGSYPALPPPDRSSSGSGLGEGVARTVGRAGTRAADAAGELGARVRGGAGAVGDAASRAADAAGDAASRVADTASGLVESASDAASRAADAGSALAGSAGEAANRVAGTARALLHDATDAVSGAVGGGLDGASDAADRARHGWDRAVSEQPLLIGALGLAVGAALGALLPRTRTEDRLMGEASDAVTGQVGTAAREGYERVKDAAAGHLDRAGDALADTYADSKERMKREGPSAAAAGDAVSRVVGEVAKAATDAAHSLADTAKEGIDAAGEKASNLAGGTEPPREPSRPASPPAPSPLAAPAILPPRPEMDGKPDPL